MVQARSRVWRLSVGYRIKNKRHASKWAQLTAGKDKCSRETHLSVLEKPNSHWRRQRIPKESMKSLESTKALVQEEEEEDQEAKALCLHQT